MAIVAVTIICLIYSLGRYEKGCMQCLALTRCAVNMHAAAQQGQGGGGEGGGVGGSQRTGYLFSDGGAVHGAQQRQP